jgi:parvulin-like peptidyl-prolyl isomerase
VRVSQILVKDKAKASKAAAAVKALSPGDEKGFRDLVAKYSEDEDSKLRGGDMTFIERQSPQLPRPVVDAAFALKEVNDVSAPVQSDKGFHVLKLTQKRPGFTRPFPEVKRQIQGRLYAEMRAKRMSAWIAEMRARLKVEMYEDKLKDVKIEAPPTALKRAGENAER